MDITTHHSISDLYKTLGLPQEHELDFTILSVPAIHHKLPYKSSLLRADYYSFILTKVGSGVYYLDENKFPFGPKSIYFTNPGHTKSYELFESKEAYIITLTEKFLSEYVHPEIFEEFPFLLAEMAPPKTLEANKFREYETLYQQILDEFENPSLYTNRILGSLFMVLLLTIKADLWSDYNPIDDGTGNSRIVNTFKQLLEKEFKAMLAEGIVNERPQVSDFAEKLYLHPNYLNSVIKSKTGKTVNDWIADRTITIAKSLLRNAQLSSKEIAYKLGFSEPTHFTRFFKKHVQVTPNDFRKAHVS